MIVRISVFFSVLILFAVVAWVSGYNFDERGTEQAWWLVCAVVFGGLAATFPRLGESK